MMQISHEVPLSVLYESESFNDYDYCLLHLTYEYEEYKKYYQEASRKGRKVLLDNSIFELGDALTLEEVAKGVEEIKPTWVVVPDCLDNKDTTIQRFKEWEDKYSYLDVLTIGVVQGNTVEELIECYLFMSEHADKIALSFDSKAYSQLINSTQELKDTSTLKQWCLGRQLFIRKLVDEDLWNYYKPHHLLGCSLAEEFSNSLYNRLNIETIDTSNPVVAAIHNQRYGTHGLTTKPSTKLCDLITHVFDSYEKRLMSYNIQMFRYICGRERKWIAFFSQTGSEISNIIKETGRYPYAVVTTNRNFIPSPNNTYFIKEKFEFNDIYIISTSIEEAEYIRLFNRLHTGKDDLITLHGYLKIIPAVVCESYNIYNLHPGLITKYPELKGKDPQIKAFNLGLKEGGVVIHEVIEEVDSGKVLLAKAISIEDFSLDEVYEKLHDLAQAAWTEFLKGETKC